MTYDLQVEIDHLRELLRREREENVKLRARLREVECLTVGGVEIEVEGRVK